MNGRPSTHPQAKPISYSRLPARSVLPPSACPAPSWARTEIDSMQPTNRPRRRGDDDGAAVAGPGGGGGRTTSSVWKRCGHVTAGGERGCTVLLTGTHLVVRYCDDDVDCDVDRDGDGDGNGNGNGVSPWKARGSDHCSTGSGSGRDRRHNHNDDGIAGPQSSDGDGRGTALLSDMRRRMGTVDRAKREAARRLQRLGNEGAMVEAIDRIDRVGDGTEWGYLREVERLYVLSSSGTPPERDDRSVAESAATAAAATTAGGSGGDDRRESFMSQRSLSSSSSSTMCTYSPGEREYLASIRERARQHLGLLSDDNDDDGDGDDDDGRNDDDNGDGNGNDIPGGSATTPEIIDRDYLAAIEERASRHLRLLSYDDEKDADGDDRRAEQQQQEEEGSRGEGGECRGEVGGECQEEGEGEEELRILEAVRERASEYLRLLPEDSYDQQERRRQGCCCHSTTTTSGSASSTGTGRRQRTLVWPLADASEVYLRHRRMVDCALEIFGPPPSSSSSPTGDGVGGDGGCCRGRLASLGTESVFLSFEASSDPGRCSRCGSDGGGGGGGTSSSSNGVIAEMGHRRDRFLAELTSSAPHLRLNEPPRPTEASRTTTTPTVITLEEVTEEWRSGRMSNYEYLLRLNASSGRSVHDVSNYPVFPWVLSNYDRGSENMCDLDLTDPGNYRDLTRPMGALDRRRLREVFLRKYGALGGGRQVGGTGDDDGSSVGSSSSSSAAAGAGSTTTSATIIPPFMYGSHYSSRGGVVLHYLVRLHPFAGLHRQLQGGRFDVADRLFVSVPRTWDMCSRTSLTEVRELTPEWYSDPAFLRNDNRFNMGTRTDGRGVGDVALPPWARGSAETFVGIMREALDGDVVSRTLHHWIDLIFGYKQRGPEAHRANNVFYHTTYYGADDLRNIRDENLRNQIEMHIADFGHAPSQLFHRPHPERRMTTSVSVSCSEGKKHVRLDASSAPPELTLQNSAGRNVGRHRMTTDDIDISQGSTSSKSWLDNVEEFKRSSSSRYAQRLPWTDTDECSSIASF